MTLCYLVTVLMIISNDVFRGKFQSQAKVPERDCNFLYFQGLLAKLHNRVNLIR